MNSNTDPNENPKHQRIFVSIILTVRVNSKNTTSWLSLIITSCIHFLMFIIVTITELDDGVFQSNNAISSFGRGKNDYMNKYWKLEINYKILNSSQDVHTTLLYINIPPNASKSAQAITNNMKVVLLWCFNNVFITCSEKVFFKISANWGLVVKS